VTATPKLQTALEQTRRTDRNVQLGLLGLERDPVRGRGAAGSLLAEAVFAHLPNGGDPLIRGQSNMSPRKSPPGGTNS
jgi:hypothetical protein